MGDQAALARFTKYADDTVPSAEGPLVAGAKAGDDRAFEALVRGYKDRILNLARRIVLDADAAEDVTQDAFIQAYRQLHRFDGRSRFGTWLYRIAINESRAYLRAQRRRRDRQRRHCSLERDQAPMAAPLEQACDLLDLLVELPVKQRTALALFYLRELSVADIAALVGAPEGTVKAWLCRGRERLRALARERGWL